LTLPPLVARELTPSHLLQHSPSTTTGGRLRLVLARGIWYLRGVVNRFGTRQLLLHDLFDVALLIGVLALLLQLR